MKPYNFQKTCMNFKYSYREFCFRNKFKIYICCALVFIALLTGIFTAVKIFNASDTSLYKIFNITHSLSELESFTSRFFPRLFSGLLVLVMITGFAQVTFLNIFGYCVITYRAFLISLNSVMLILMLSISGVVKSIIIILPCQLIMICIFVLYFTFACGDAKDKKYCKNTGIKRIIPPFLIATLALFIVNLLETILLFVFKSTVILVI